MIAFILCIIFSDMYYLLEPRLWSHFIHHRILINCFCVDGRIPETNNAMAQVRGKQLIKLIKTRVRLPFPKLTLHSAVQLLVYQSPFHLKCIKKPS